MIVTDEAALRCDMAQTYHIFDYRALPARQAALFAYGLPEDSRIRRKLSGTAISMETRLLALIADALQMLVWQNSRDAQRGRNRPHSVLAAITAEEQRTDGVGFESAEDFEAWRASMLTGE